MPTLKVRVREGQRGEYGVAGSEPDPAHKTGVAGFTHIIRNAGEIFTMDVRAMKPAGASGTGMCEVVKIDGREYALPSWVESVKAKELREIKNEDPGKLVPSGHQTRHDKNTVI